ncbi:MAG TPA: hypothetical protein PKY50_06065 [Candidatus Competibacter sp.]|nr:hypothetical protein [Candidatus Competibacter sp.]
MKAPEHKRYLYAYPGSDIQHVGIIMKIEMRKQIMDAGLSDDDLQGVTTDEELFERTFRYASKFVGWLDDEWRTS